MPSRLCEASINAPPFLSRREDAETLAASKDVVATLTQGHRRPRAVAPSQRRASSRAIGEARAARARRPARARRRRRGGGGRGSRSQPAIGSRGVTRVTAARCTECLDEVPEWEERDTEDRTRQVEVVSWALRFTPSHRRKPPQGFSNVSERDYD